MRIKRLYRVEAVQRTDGRVWKRDYQSATAATERGARLRRDPSVTGVTITASDPITWPEP
jgi:hypothetical protein